MNTIPLLRDKVAFITGSSRGIGWAIAELFAAHGAHIILNGHRDAAALENKKAALEKQFGVKTLSYFGDITDTAALQNFYQDIFKTFGRLDILVNNAGILDDKLIGMITDASIQQTFSVNTFAVIHNLQLAARLMRRNASGSIINVSSIIGTHGNDGQVVYGGSKAAVIGITQSAAKELAPQNIRVNAITPGFIETDMVKQLPADKYQERLAGIKMQRIGKPSEVANVALFLAADLSSYVTGQVIGVDGGMVI